MAVFVFAISRWGADFIAFFDDDPRVLAAGAAYLRIVAWSYVLFGGGIVLSQAMGGAGATLASLRADLLSVVPLALVFVFVARGGAATSLYWAIAIGHVVSALVFGAVYRFGPWRVHAEGT